METKHTPIGDWEICRCSNVYYGSFFIPAVLRHVNAAKTDEDWEVIKAEDAANQKLLQAAPATLQALYDLASKAARVVERWKSGDLAGAVRELDQSRREARKVIKQATGESEKN